MKPTDYHAIALWDKQLGRKKSYTQREQAHAAETRAPLDAIYRNSDTTWVCVTDLHPDHNFRADYKAYLEKSTMPVPFHYIRRLHELYPKDYTEPTFDLVIIDRDQRHRVSDNNWCCAEDAETEFKDWMRAGLPDLGDWGDVSDLMPRPEPTRPPPVPASVLSNLRMVAGNEKKYSRVIMNKHVLHWVSLGWVNEGPARSSDFEVYPVVID